MTPETTPTRELCAQSSMASTAFSLEVARGQLDEYGFFDLQDSAMGEHMRQMEHRGFPLISEYGLDFCKDLVINDEVSVLIPMMVAI